MTPNRSIGLLLYEILPFYLIADLQRVGSDFFHRGRAVFGLLHQLTFLLTRGREGGGRIGASFFPNLAERRARGGVDLLPVATTPGQPPPPSLFKAIWFVQQVPQERPRLLHAAPVKF